MVDGLFDNLTCKPKLIIKHSDNLNYVTLETITDPTLPNLLTLQINKNVSLPCAIIPLAQEDLIGYIWGHEAGIWQPDKKKNSSRRQLYQI